MSSFNDGDLFFIAVGIQLFSILFLFIKQQKKALYFSNSIFILGLIIGLISTISTNIFSNDKFVPQLLAFKFIRLDGLSIYFDFIIQLVAIPTAIYNYSYLNHYIENKKSIKSFLSFFIIMVVATRLIVIANHAIFFLVVWETMSLTSYLAMLLEKEKEEVQKGSFYYLIASHALIFIIYIMFFILHHSTGSWYFQDFYSTTFAPITAAIIFTLALVGFGIKAGFMPFHFWLPQAHPIAPTVLSAFLSGVIIKAGIYGIIRVYLFLKPLPEYFGWIVLVISMISAIFGVWYALAQHDIKRLLAYHSVENIGIIGIGLAIGFIGAANKIPAIEYLGFGGALLHTLNHAIFKSLLFIGSGVIYQNLHTRNIEAMGGIVHRAKLLSILFLIGSVAISGIPPFNGFISEFIIYSGFFRTANELKNFYPILMLLFVVGLAFVGGLAVACFTKVNSIMFLGSERKEVKKFHVSFYDYLSLIIFSALCVFIGFYPTPFVGIINKVISLEFTPRNYSASLVDINWLYFSLIFFLIALMILLLFLIKRKIELKFGYRKSDAWGCGYNKLNPRMQYTASSFADELNSIPKSILLYKKKIQVSETAFPVNSEFESHSKDYIDNKIMRPAISFLHRLIPYVDFTKHTDIRYYIGYIIIIIAIYSLLTFI